MDLTAAVVDRSLAAYDDVQPLSTVEAEHVEILPEMFERGEFGWRDAEWVVQWYYRRFLGAYPNAERRAREAAYGENSYEAVERAIAGAREADGTAGKLGRLTALDGVDVPVASAFLQFLHPEHFLVCSEREWAVLRAAGELDVSYPDPPTVAAYERYLEACRRVAERCDCSLWALYRTLWVLGGEQDD